MTGAKFPLVLSVFLDKAGHDRTENLCTLGKRFNRDRSQVKAESIIFVIFVKESLLPGLTVRTTQGGINTLRNIRLGFIRHDEMMAQSGETVMDRPS